MKNKNYSASAVDDILLRFDNIFDMNTPAEQELKLKYNEIIEKNIRNKQQWGKMRMIDFGHSFVRHKIHIGRERNQKVKRNIEYG